MRILRVEDARALADGLQRALRLDGYAVDWSDDGSNRYKDSPHFIEAEKALMDLTVQIGIDANHVPGELWERLHKHFTEPQIVEAAFTITVYIAVSKFSDALGVSLERVFSGIKPILHIKH